MINVSQAFHRTSAAPVDDTLALTKAEMLTVNDNLMPQKYLTVCQDDGYIYLYDKSATPNQTTGKFTKFEGGSQVDTSKLYSTDDTASTDIADADYIPFYDISASGRKKTLWSNIKSVLKTYFDGIYVAAPTGTIISFMGVTAPTGYLICDGSSYSTSTYSNLANFFNTQFGSKYYFGGSGSSFKVPDLRGEFLRGTGTNSHSNQGSGISVGLHQDATVLPNIYYDDTNKNIATANTASSGSNMPTNQDITISSGGTGTGRYAALNQSWNGNTTDMRKYTTRPTNTSVLYCIKY